MVNYIYSFFNLKPQRDDGFLGHKDYQVLVASKKIIYEVYSVFDEERVKALNLKWDEPVPKEYCSNYYINPNDKSDLEKLRLVKEDFNDSCHQVYIAEHFLYPFLVHDKEFDDCKHLQLFSRKDFDQKEKLHLVDYDGEIYFLYYLSFYRFDHTLETEKEKAIRISLFRTSKILQIEKLIKSFYNGSITNIGANNNSVWDFDSII